MQLYTFALPAGGPITEYESRQAHFVRIFQNTDPLDQVSYIRHGAGGLIGRHPATAEQLMLVITGSGHVSGAEGRPRPVASGAAVHWQAGEDHETIADEAGMVIVIIEWPSLKPDQHLRALGQATRE